MITGMDLKEQLVIWKRAEYLIDNMAWTSKLQDRLVHEGVLTAPMVADIESHNYHVERKLRLLTLLGSHNTGVFGRFLRALQQSDHGPLVKEIQRAYKLTKFGEMLPPSFTYFLDVSEFLRKYPHIGLKLGEEGKHLLHTFIEGKIAIEHRKRTEQLKTLEAENVRLVKEMENIENMMADMREKQRTAESLWATSGDRIDHLKARVEELQDMNRAHLQEIRHLKHFQKIQNDMEEFLENEYKEHLPVTKGKSHVSKESSGPVVTVTPTDLHKFYLLQSQVSFNLVRLDLIQTSIQNLGREEKRVQHVHDVMEKGPAEEIDSTVIKDVKDFLSEIQKTKKQLETQLRDGEDDLAFQEKQLETKENEFQIESEINVRTDVDLIPKLKAIIDNIKIAHARKLREKQVNHEKEIDKMIDRIQKLNQKHMEDVEKLRGTIRKKMFEIHKREQLHKKLRSQIRVMENYQARNMNSTVSVEQCRRIVRAIIGEARILRNIANEKESVMQQAAEEAERKMGTKSKGVTGAGKKGTGSKGKKRKIPDSLNEEHLRYMAEKIHQDWRGFGQMLGMTENRMDIVEMDAGSGGSERMAYSMLRVWRDEEDGKPHHLARAFLQMDRQDMATLLVPFSKLVALRETLVAEAGEHAQDEDDEDIRTATVTSSVTTLPKIAVS